VVILHLHFLILLLEVNQYISSCKKGNRKAQKALYEACAPYVFTIIQRYIFRKEDHRDLMQEAFAKVFLKISQFDIQKGPFKGWLRQIVINECLQHLRKHKQMKVVSSQLAPEDFPLADEQTLPTDLTRDDIDRILTDMPDGYKVIFMLHVMDGYEHKEISEMLDISPKTSRSQLTRAKRWIQNQFSTATKSEIHGLL